MIKYHVLTYYTEGPPHDSGADLKEAESKFREKVTPFSDNYLSFCPRTLIEKNPSFYEYCKDYSYLKESVNQNVDYYDPWIQNGLMMWKPHLIKMALESNEINYGDYLLYHDVNVLKYPQYLHGQEEWKWILKDIFDDLRCDIFVPFGYPLNFDVKADLLKKYSVDGEELGLWAGTMAFRKSGASLFFLKEWTEMTNIENNSPFSNKEKNHKNFVWHATEQAVVSVLSKIWIKNKLLPENWPKYRFRDRVFSSDYLEIKT